MKTKRVVIFAHEMTGLENVQTNRVVMFDSETHMCDSAGILFGGVNRARTAEGCTPRNKLKCRRSMRDH